MPKIKVGDINIYYEVYGEGEPLVFIAGLSSSISSSFLDIPAFFSKY